MAIFMNIMHYVTQKISLELHNLILYVYDNGILLLLFVGNNNNDDNNNNAIIIIRFYNNRTPLQS